jgi:hypothetical protein
MPKEIWKPVLGLVGFYAVSNLGRVKSLERQCKTSTTAGYRTVPEKILKPILWARYWSVQLCVFGVVRRRSFHELVLAAFVGPCPKGMWCRHLDGNRDNNTLPNLKWGTHLENEADKQSHGTTARGIRNGNSKLTEEQVRYILSSPKTQKEVAREIGCSQAWVSLVRRREVWRHIK